MTHEQQVKQTLSEWGFPLNKIIVSNSEKIFYNRKKEELENEKYSFDINEKLFLNIEKCSMSLLYTNTEKLMEEFKSRVSNSEKTIIYVYDNSPKFFPVIKNNIFELVKVAFVKKFDQLKS